MLKTKSKKVWVSYGIMCELFAWLRKDEKLRFQILNMFSYRILVSRAQITIPLVLDGLIFSIGYYNSTKIHTLYIYNEKTEVCRELEYENVELKDTFVI